MRKFWPLALENRKPWRANSPLTSWALHKSIMKKPPFPCILPEDRRICNENLHQKQDGSRYCFRTGAEAPLASPGGEGRALPRRGEIKYVTRFKLMNQPCREVSPEYTRCRSGGQRRSIRPGCRSTGRSCSPGWRRRSPLPWRSRRCRSRHRRRYTSGCHRG